MPTLFRMYIHPSGGVSGHGDLSKPAMAVGNYRISPADWSRGLQMLSPQRSLFPLSKLIHDILHILRGTRLLRASQPGIPGICWHTYGTGVGL
jgi:hypothetical protein